ncbi:hypothetical protein LQW54_001911 [Pestalotiopsis sp. IQ-011]
MPWWNSTSKDSTNTRAGASADMPIDLRASKEKEDIAISASRGRLVNTTKLTYSKSLKRSQTSPVMSEQATSTKRAKGTDQTDVKLDHSETSDSDLFEMTEEHEDSKALVTKLRAIISRQSEEIQEFQTELRTARVKQLEHTELHGADRTIRSLRVRTSNQSDRIRDLQSQLSAAKAQYSSDALKLDQANCDLKRELLEMTQKRDDLQTSVSDLEELNSAQREEIESWTHDFYTTAQAYEKLKNAMRDEVEAATIPLRALTETQSDQIEQLEKDQQAAEAKYKKLEQGRNKLKDKLESARLSGTKRAVRHRRAYRRLKHDTNSVRAELEAVTVERDELNAKLNEIEAQLVATEDELQWQEHEEDNEPEDCIVVICVDLSNGYRRCLDHVKLAYTTIIMFLQARWGEHARVAVIVHGCEENSAHEAHKIDCKTWDLVENEASEGDSDYNFCIKKAKDILAREEASNKVIVMIGDSSDIYFDEESLDEPITYLRSNHIPAHSIVIREDLEEEYMYKPCDAHPLLTSLIGGRETNHVEYCRDLEDILGREMKTFRCFYNLGRST